MRPASNEVRFCPTCEQPAVLLVTEWEHARTGQWTQEYRCQHCGNWYIKGPPSTQRGLWLLGILLTGTTCFLGLPFLYVARQLLRFDKRVPVVPHAEVPALRFPGGPPKRTCAQCQGIAAPEEVTRNTRGGVPLGELYCYRCGQCGRTFTVLNLAGHVKSAIQVALLGVIATLCFVSGQTLSWRWAGFAAVAVGLLIVAQNLLQLMNRARNPPRKERGP